MKDKYIKEVEKLIPLPGRAKKEVLRDLEEAFASAAEHGETEEQVIQRLGSPKEFAENLNEQINFELFTQEHKKRKQMLIIVCTFIFSMLMFGLYAALKAAALTREIGGIGIIGGADGPTAIFVADPGMDFSMVAVILGIAAFAASIILTIRYIYKNRGDKK